MGQTLKTIQSRGVLNCGANGNLAGFGLPDAQGNWTGFDVDYCRAIAAAIFNDPTKVKFIPLTAKDRFTALQSGEVDVLLRNTTWTSSRDTTNGLNFTGVNYFDGQGFLVRKALKVNSAMELNDAAVCVQQGTTTELNLADFFRANNMKLKTVTFATSDEAVKAYDAGRCDAYTTDASALYGERLRTVNPDDHVVLPDIISKEPLGPCGPSCRRPVVRYRALGAFRAAQRRGTRRQQGQYRGAIALRKSRNPPPARCRGQGRRGVRSDQRFRRADRQECRQLRRDFRTAISAPIRR